MITLHDPTLNEIYKHLFHDDTIPRGMLKKWTDRLTLVDRQAGAGMPETAKDEPASKRR